MGEKMANSQLVLIIEDSKTVALTQKRCLEDERIEVLWAETIEKAKNILKERAKEISVIILDACLQSEKPNTMCLIPEARARGFRGSIITSSSNDDYSQTLMRAGATYKSDKTDAVKTALLTLKNFE